MKFRDNLPDAGAKSYLRLKDGESVKGIFRGDPYEFFSIFKDGKSIVVREGTQGASFRFKINFIVKDGVTYSPKIFENGLTVYKTLSELNNEYDLETTIVKITRNGIGLDTTYSVLPLLKDELSEETKRFIGSIKLLDLEHKRQEVEPPFPTDDDLPF